MNPHPDASGYYSHYPEPEPSVPLVMTMLPWRVKLRNSTIAAFETLSLAAAFVDSGSAFTDPDDDLTHITIVCVFEVV